MRTILLFIAINMLFACSENAKAPVHISKLQSRNNIYFLVNQEEPFKGTAIDTFNTGQIKKQISISEGLLNGESRVYFENGQLNLTTNYSKGLKDEKEIHYFKNGKLRSEGTYDSDKKNGSFQYYNDEGRLTSECNFKDDKLHGVYKSYYPNGNLETSANYLDGEYNGFYEQLFEDGTKRKTYNYTKGNRNGECTDYNKDGTISRSYLYENSIVLKNLGKWNATAKNSNDRDIRFTISFDEHGNPNQPYKEYNLDGGLIYEGNYLDFDNRIKDGKHISYYDDGQVKQVVNYKKGDLHGEFTSFHPEKNYVDDSRLLEKGTFVDGLQEGYYVRYLANGSFITPKLLGRADGKNGTYKTEATFIKGRVHGIVKHWHRYQHHFEKYAWNLPLYIGHEYNHGKAIYLSNGLGIKGSNKTFNDRWYDLNDNRVTYKAQGPILDEMRAKRQIAPGPYK